MALLRIFPSIKKIEGITGNRIRDLIISTQELRPQDHEANKTAKYLIDASYLNLVKNKSVRRSVLTIAHRLLGDVISTIR